MKVLNFGSLNLDYTYQVETILIPGETQASKSREIFCGGKGLNQSIALAKAGVPVYHAGMIGEEGEILLETCRENGVNTEFIRKIDGPSGHTIIQVDKNGQNCILLYGGANQEITRAQVDAAMECFEAGDFLVLQNEINEIAYIMEKAHEKGMKIVLNPSPMDEKIAGYPLDYVDYFLLNEIEAGDICGCQGSGRELLDKLGERFPGAKIVLTLGGDGSMYKDGDLVLEQPIYRVPVVDTTAAGDTFTGFFIGGLMRGEEPKTALDHAAKAAAIAVSRPGAAPSIPDRSEVE